MAGKTPKFFVHEQMMEQWEKEGRVRNEEVSIKALTLDLCLQARVETLDAGNVSVLERVLLDGLVLAPIIVFEIDGKDYVGDGFHRTEAHKRNGRRSINARVVRGATMQEAVEYATSCNKANHSLPMTSADKKKAMFMLLENGWLDRSHDHIGRHAGVSSSTAQRYIAEYCEKTGRTPPVDRYRSDGKRCGRRIEWLAPREYAAHTKSGSKFSVVIKGKNVHLGTTKEEAELKLKEIKNQIKRRGDEITSTINIADKLAKRGLHLRKAGHTEGLVGGLNGGAVRGFAVVVLEVGNVQRGPFAKQVAYVLGCVFLMAKYFKCSRLVVLAYGLSESQEKLLAPLRDLGVEILTPEQFVEVANSDPDSDAAPVPSPDDSPSPAPLMA